MSVSVLPPLAEPVPFFRPSFRGPKQVRDKVTSVPRQHQDTPENYFRYVNSLASKHKAPIVIRQGGHDDLGLLSIEIQFENQQKIKSWSLFDCPKRWDRDAVSTFLTQQFWTSISVQQRQYGRSRFNGPTWIFQGIPPQNPQKKEFKGTKCDYFSSCSYQTKNPSY